MKTSIRFSIIRSAVVTLSAALLSGCSSAGTYYPKTSTHVRQTPAETRESEFAARQSPKSPESEHRPVFRGDAEGVRASRNRFPTRPHANELLTDTPASLESPPISKSSEPTTLSVELSSDIVPVDYESTRPYDDGLVESGEPVQVPLPEPESQTDSSTNGSSTQSMTLDQLEALAIEHNPSIKQASASAEKASALRTQVGLKPNPQLSYFAEEMGSNSSAGLQGASISQTFVTGNKLQASQRVIDQDYQRILWDVEMQRYRVRTDVRTSFYRALAAQQRMQLAKEFLKVAQQGLNITQQRFDAQEGARPDVLQAEIQLSEIEIIQQRAAVEYQAAWNELVTTVGLPETLPVPLEGELPTQMPEREFEALYQQLLSSSPELQSALSRVQVARAALKRQDIQAIPNVIGQFGVGQDNSNGNKFANVQLSVSLPIHNRNQGNIRAAYADYCRATQDVARLKLAIRSRLVDALRTYNQAGIEVKQYSTVILPKAQESMLLSEQAYLAGQFDFLRIFNARITYFEANLAYVQAQSDLAVAEAQIEGLLLSGGLNQPADYDRDDTHRQQTFSQQ